jgi:protein SCO1/2
MSGCRLRVLTVLPVVTMVIAGCTGGESAGDDSVVPQPQLMGSEASGGDRFRGAEVGEYAMPDITLEDTDGQSFNLVTDTTDPITLVFFGYTHCPDVCPLVMTDLAVAFAQLPDSVAAQTQIVFITTDPARDTPSVIRSYLDRYNPAFIGLTGPLRDIKAAADDLQVAIEGRRRLREGGYDVGHGAQVIGFLHDEAPVVWTEGTPVEAMVADISVLAGA